MSTSFTASGTWTAPAGVTQVDYLVVAGGAGGGGFMLFLTPPEKQAEVSKRLGLKEVPIDFEFLGSQLIYHDYQDQEV